MKTLILLSPFVFMLLGCAVIQSNEAIIGCQAADAATTLAAIHTGLAKEGNPIVAKMLESPLGAPGFIALKAMIALVLLSWREKSPEAVGVVNAASCGAAALNMRFL